MDEVRIEIVDGPAEPEDGVLIADQTKQEARKVAGRQE
jgi:hypothetical protein